MLDTDEKLQELENRIKVLEKIVLAEDESKDWTKDYSGLKGGMNLLIDNNFFAEPRSLREIDVELKREGYHYLKPSISKKLSVDLTNKQKLLTRIKIEKNWKYVIRK